MNAITLISEVRCGDDHAAYYLTERAQIVARGESLAMLLWTDNTCDGLHDVRGGIFFGPMTEDWKPVTEIDSAVRAIIDDWTDCGWTLEGKAGHG